MNRNELIAAVNKLKIPLKQVSEETSIPVGALNKFWQNKKDLQELEFDSLVKWVIGKNNEPERKKELLERRSEPNEMPVESSFESERVLPYVADEFGQMPDLRFSKPKPWIKKIEDFCYLNKITPEELIQGYVAPRVKPIPRHHP